MVRRRSARDSRPARVGSKAAVEDRPDAQSRRRRLRATVLIEHASGFHSSLAYLQTDANLSGVIVGEDNAGLFKGLLYL
jgi:hypothetical protein